MYQVAMPSTCKVEHITCGFHKKHPGHNFPGCTCSSSYSTHVKPLEDWTKEERDWYFAALAGEKPDGTPLF